jgi:HK97 family phage portal protein
MDYTSPFYAFDAANKAIPISQLPDSAWDYIMGGPSEKTGVAEKYDAVGWLYRCVQLRANALSLVPWVVEKNGESAWKHDEEPPKALEWLSNMSRLLWLSEAANTLVGNSFWFVEKSRTRYLGLRWMAPHSVKPKWDSRAGLTHFERNLGNGNPPIRFELDEVVFFSLLNPLHETEPGTSPAQAALTSAGVLMSVDRFAAGFFDRGAIKATLLTIPPNTSTEEAEKLKAWWQRFFSGVQKAWSTNVVSTSVQPVPIGEGMESLSNNTLTTERREDIATTLGIPHSIVFSNAANYATAQIDERNFYNLTILPSAAILGRALNEQLLNPLGLHLRFLPQEMSIFQEDEEQRSGALVNLINAGVPLQAAFEILGYSINEETQAIIDSAYTVMLQEPQDDSDDIPVIDTSSDAEKQADLARWRRKAKKALKSGKAADVPFESEHIPGDEAKTIGEFLKYATTNEEVDVAFSDTPFRLSFEGYP